MKGTQRATKDQEEGGDREAAEMETDIATNDDTAMKAKTNMATRTTKGEGEID